MDNSLHVLVGLLEFPQPLVGAGLVLHGADDVGAVYSFAAADRILEDLLRFLQINQCFIILFVFDAHDG